MALVTIYGMSNTPSLEAPPVAPPTPALPVPTAPRPVALDAAGAALTGALERSGPGPSTTGAPTPDVLAGPQAAAHLEAAPPNPAHPLQAVIDHAAEPGLGDSRGVGSGEASLEDTTPVPEAPTERKTTTSQALSENAQRIKDIRTALAAPEGVTESQRAELMRDLRDAQITRYWLSQQNAIEMADRLDAIGRASAAASNEKRNNVVVQGQEEAVEVPGEENRKALQAAGERLKAIDAQLANTPEGLDRDNLKQQRSEAERVLREEERIYSRQLLVESWAKAARGQTSELDATNALPNYESYGIPKNKIQEVLISLLADAINGLSEKGRNLQEILPVQSATEQQSAREGADALTFIKLALKLLIGLLLRALIDRNLLNMVQQGGENQSLPADGAKTPPPAPAAPVTAPTGATKS